MERRRCKKCGVVIPKQRLEVLHDTTTCVDCSRVKAKTSADVDCTDGVDGDDNVRSMQSGSNHRSK